MDDIEEFPIIHVDEISISAANASAFPCGLEKVFARFGLNFIYCVRLKIYSLLSCFKNSPLSVVLNQHIVIYCTISTIV
ncbi:hypothetical protein GE061_013733 [Apolygus lucorum]|uniref:Uncharacterized protein n=1 Tax=Apolygus lucorum TaxID=248454 RepID=A0A6A4KCC1_APOLU|nr:hypothetical protein GE061_013733 [Apolygus lucorum]